MRTARLGPTAAVLCGALALAGCGKGASGTSGPTATGSASALAPVAKQGAVSVVTRNTTRVGGADPASDAAAVARVVYPALTPSTRPAAVVVVDEHNWTAALAASSLASAPLRAPVLYSQGDTLPQVTAQTLSTLAPSGSAGALGGAQVLRVANRAPLPGNLAVQTLPVAQPAQVAAEIEHVLHQVSGHAPRQVIVVPSNATPALAMPAAGLAAESGAPILYVTQSRVPPATASLLAHLAHPSIYVIDAAQAGRPALSELRRYGPVTTISPGGEEGAAANAVTVARFTDAQFGWGVKEPGHGLVFANYARPLDAPAAAPLSATGDYGPLLLLESASQIPAPLANYLADIQPAYTPAFNFRPVRGVYNHGWLIGDESAIAATAQAEIDSLLEISPRKQSSEPSVSQVE